jgi:hypothetical protein
VIMYNLRLAADMGTFILSPNLLSEYLLSSIFEACKAFITACLIFSFVGDGERRRSVGPIM